MKQPVRCPAGTLYDASVHAECPCPSCWADRSSATLAGKANFVSNSKSDKKANPFPTVAPQEVNQEAIAVAPSHKMKRQSPKGRASATRNFLIGIGAVLIGAVAIYSGAMLWIQNRVESEIESAFAVMRADLGTATYGQVKFDWWSRDVSITSILLQAKSVPNPTIKVGRLVISGGAMTLPDWFSAQHVDITEAELRYGKGSAARADSLKFDGLGFALSKIHFADFLALTGAAPQPISALVVSELVNKFAETSENIRVGKFEIRGLTLNDSPNLLKLSVLRSNKLENGHLAEFIVEGINLTPPQQSVNARRLTLKGINIAGLLRKSAQFSLIGQAPTPAQVAEFLPLLEAIEIDGFTAPDERAGRSPVQLIRIESFRASWGQFIGTVPSSARITANITGPISVADRDPFKALAEAGHNSLTFGFDIAGVWAGNTKTFVIAPIVFEVRNLFTASAKLSIANVSPNIFVVDPTRFTFAASSLEAGPIEFSLRDTGGLDLWIAQVAKTQGISLVAARKTQIDNMYKNAQTQSQMNPALQRLVNVASQFIETPRATLRINLTPKGKVNLTQVIELVKANPAGALSALSQFNLDAAVTR